MFKRVTMKLRSITNAVNTTLRKSFAGSDYKRWATDGNLSSSWDSRTEQIAKSIGAGTSVIEFGAGRLVLKKFLPACCTYTPSDIADRGHGTIVCDLNNKELPQFKFYDCAVFSGVLEYVNDVPRLISHLSKSVDAIIASYAVLEFNNKNRKALGWVNDYDSDQFVAIFKGLGFQCERTEKWQSQVIYIFKNRNQQRKCVRT